MILDDLAVLAADVVVLDDLAVLAADVVLDDLAVLAADVVVLDDLAVLLIWPWLLCRQCLCQHRARSVPQTSTRATQF
jgi:hypothetical protein